MDEWKRACDEIKMSQEQKRRIWYHAKSEVKMKKVNEKRRRQRILSVCCAVAMLIVLCIGAVPALLKIGTEREGAAVVTLEEQQEQQERQEPVSEAFGQEEEKVWSHYLILGTDTREENNAYARCDTVIVASLEQNTKKVRLTTIPRNLIVPVSLEKKGQELPKEEIYDYETYQMLVEDGFVCARDFTLTAESENMKEQAETAAQIVQEQFELPLEGYIYVNWSGFITVINQLGGVALNVTEADLDETYSYMNGFITEIVESTGIGSVQIEKTGEQLLDGVQALAWCRVRKPIGEQGRENRQIELIGTVLDKIKQCKVSELIDIAGTVISSVNTNLTVEQAVDILKDVNKYQMEESWNLADSEFVADADESKEWKKITNQEALIQEIHNYFEAGN